MARFDNIGLFWEDQSQTELRYIEYLTNHDWKNVRPGFWVHNKHIINIDTDHQEKAISVFDAYPICRSENTSVKKDPPEPTWLEDDYLPYLEESLEFNVDLFTDNELIDASFSKTHELVFDIECYPNYFLIAFKSPTLQKVVYFEKINDSKLDILKLTWVVTNFKLIGFNSIKYDEIVLLLALKGCSNEKLQTTTTEIIDLGLWGAAILKNNKVKRLPLNHVDLIEVAPLSANLKIYGGRVNTKKMQDLPFKPGKILSDNQIAITRFYCINDLNTTIDLKNAIQKELNLRESMSAQYGLDLRSKSDAQIAEAVIKSELEKLGITQNKPPIIPAGTIFKYDVPHFLKYESALMNHVLSLIASLNFEVAEKSGKTLMPEELKKLKINIANTCYKIGKGGLHSTEEHRFIKCDDDHILVDKDVTSYYPYIILLLKLFPKHLGILFLQVFGTIVETRVSAKKASLKLIAEVLKIVVNGSFGKLGSKYSILYAPDLLNQVTITGQLTLLMLIERLELQSIPVVSANTDGIIINCPKVKEALMESIVKQWEIDTGFNMESTYYDSVYSRGVNDYIAIKDKKHLVEDDSLIKTKGAFGTAGLSKNPTSEVCVDAVIDFLVDKVPIANTIKGCTVLSKFITVRAVKGGGVKDGVFLGKAVRWYYAEGVEGDIIYAKSGNKVPKSDGAKPLMELPDEFPNDINYTRYIDEAYKLLESVGVSTNEDY